MHSKPLYIYTVYIYILNINYICVYNIIYIITIYIALYICICKLFALSAAGGCHTPLTQCSSFHDLTWFMES